MTGTKAGRYLHFEYAIFQTLGQCDRNQSRSDRIITQYNGIIGDAIALL